MKKFLALAIVLACLLLPQSAGATPALSFKSTVMSIEIPPLRNGSHIQVIAHLTTSSGAPLENMQVIFRVGDDYDGLARTDATGRATWRLRRQLPIGTYQLVAVFNGTRSFGPSHAYGQDTVSATTLTVAVDTSLNTGDRRAIASARLADSNGTLIPDAHISFTLDGAPAGEAITDASGTATVPLHTLGGGTHTVAAHFDGTPSLLATDGAADLTVGAARLTAQLGPPLSAVDPFPVVAARLLDANGAPIANARITFTVDGVPAGVARTDASGKATRRIQIALRPGKHSVVASYAGRPDLLPTRATTALAIASTQLNLQFDPSRSQGGQRAPIVAHLSSTNGAPIANARITFMVGGARDGEAFTDGTGTAVWWIKQDLPAGNHTIGGVFDGLPQLLGTRATTNVAVAPTKLELRTAQAITRVGEPATVIAHLVDANAVPAKNARIQLFIDGAPHGEIRTDELGIASRRLTSDLPAGSYTVETAFDGLPGLLPSRTSMPLLVQPAVVEIQTVPALAGVRFALDNRTFVSGADGIARIEVARAGEYTLEVLPWSDDLSGVRAAFDRWADALFISKRTIKVPSHAQLSAGFNVSYLVNLAFVDPTGHPIDPQRIGSLALTSSSGIRQTIQDVRPSWFQSQNVVRETHGLTTTQIVYALQNVTIDGANVVNQAQQRFAVRSNQPWQVELQLYSARFSTRDALFGFPIGSSLHITYPDGQSRTHPLGPDGTVQIDLLARGPYTVRIEAPGFVGPTPLVLSHDQDVVLPVLSYLDVAVVGVLLLAIALGLLLVGRPKLAALVRHPLVPFRRAANGRRPVWAWLAGSQYHASLARHELILAEQTAGGIAPATGARGRVGRWLLDPALIFAAMLVALGSLGVVLARSAVVTAPVVVDQPARAASPVAVAAALVPTSVAASAPTAAPIASAPTAQPIASAPTAQPTVAPTAVPATPAQLAYSTSLRRASKGPDVSKLQQRLRELGYFDYPENTGYFGDNTARAVAQFQAQQGLAASGVADQATIEALNRCGDSCIEAGKRAGHD